MVSNTIRILLVEDDPTDAAFTRAMLGRVRHAAVDVTWVDTVEAALDALRAGGVDLVLVDYLLASRTGLDLVRTASDEGISTPMILLTGKGSRELDLEALEAGVDDYLVKGRIDPGSLERALRYALERARGRRDLVESEARFRGLFDHLPLGLFRCTPEGGFLDANPALLELLGDPSPTVLRERYAAHLFVHPSDAPGLRETLEADGIVRAFESWLERGEGFHLPVRTTARAHRDGSGGIAYVEGVVEDVRERESMDRIRRAHDRLRTLVDHLGLELVVVGADRRVLDVSPALAARLGVERAQVLAEPLSRVLDEDGVETLWRALAADGKDGDAPARFRTRDATGAGIEVVGAPVVDGAAATGEVLLRITVVPGP